MMALLVWEPPLFSQEATGRRDACRRTCDKSRGGGRPDRAFREGKVYQVGWPGRARPEQVLHPSPVTSSCRLLFTLS